MVLASPSRIQKIQRPQKSEPTVTTLQFFLACTNLGIASQQATLTLLTDTGVEVKVRLFSLLEVFSSYILEIKEPIHLQPTKSCVESRVGREKRTQLDPSPSRRV